MQTNFIDANILLPNIIMLILLFILAFLGALSNDYTNTLKGRDSEIKICRVLIGSFAATLTMFVFSDIIIAKTSMKFLLFVTYLTGIGGFSLFGNLQNIEMYKIVHKKIEALFKS